MKRLILIACSLAIICGCDNINTKKKDYSDLSNPDTESSASGKPVPNGAAGSSGNGGDNIQIQTGGAGAAGVTPVTGGENLGSGGGSVGSAAKDAARGAAAKASGPKTGGESSEGGE